MENNYQFELGELLGKIQTANNYWLHLVESEPNKVKRYDNYLYMTMHQRERNIVWTNMLIDARLQILELFPSCTVTIDELRDKIERLDEDNRYVIDVTFNKVTKRINLIWN